MILRTRSREGAEHQAVLGIEGFRRAARACSKGHARASENRINFRVSAPPRGTHFAH